VVNCVHQKEVAMSTSTTKAKKHRRSAIQVANSQNILILRKLVQEGVIPNEKMTALIQEYLPVAEQKAAQ
jgi:hypothetical protein